MSVDQREYRNTIGLFATGVTVITARAGEETRGMTANAVTSVSLEPLLLLVCIDRRAHMAGLIVEAGRFAVNILREDQEQLSQHFAGRPQPGLAPRLVEIAGTPTLDESLAALVCSVERVLDGGDHIIVIGRVEALHRAEQGAAPLLYFRGQYHSLLGPQEAMTPSARASSGLSA